eukprot:11348805-Alexandrium_andersonii.AAC.1
MAHGRPHANRGRGHAECAADGGLARRGGAEHVARRAADSDGAIAVLGAPPRRDGLGRRQEGHVRAHLARVQAPTQRSLA